MNELIIIGAGGFGREVLEWARTSAGEWVIKGFLDDNPRALDGFGSDLPPILGSVADYRLTTNDIFVCAIGQVAAKRRCVEAVLARGGLFTSVIHATAVCSRRARLGQGVILCPNAIVSPDAELGDFVTVNLHSSVAHDAKVGRWTQLHCHVDITGGVELGEGVLVGSHASVLPRVRVGAGATVGAGSVVVQDVAPGVTVVGVPARPYVTKPVAHA